MLMLLVLFMLEPDLNVFGPSPVTSAPAFLDVMPARTVESLPLQALDVFGPVAVAKAAPLRRRIQYLGMKSCSGCNWFHRNEEPALKKSGWRFGSEASDHICTMDDSDKEAFDATCDKYGVTMLPAIVLLEDGYSPVTVQSSPAHVINRHDVAQLYNSKRTTPPKVAGK